MSPDLSMALGKINISDCKAMLILSAIASACRKDINEVVSRSTLQRQRIATCKNIADDLKQTFTFNTPLNVQRNGKLFQNIERHGTVDRLAII